MRVLVDTSVWSMALRSKRTVDDPAVAELREVRLDSEGVEARINETGREDLMRIQILRRATPLDFLFSLRRRVPCCETAGLSHNNGVFSTLTSIRSHK